MGGLLRSMPPFLKEGLHQPHVTATDVHGNRGVSTVAQIHSQKKRTGVIAPKRFVQRLKKDNELFRSYMHQVELSQTCSLTC